MGNRSSSESEAFYQVLPSELILQIFGYLDDKNLLQAAKVCKQFKQIAYDESLWHELTKKNINL